MATNDKPKPGIPEQSFKIDPDIVYDTIPEYCAVTKSELQIILEQLAENNGEH